MAFSFSRTITIDHTKVPSTQTNFPVLISGTYTYLKTVGNGGNVQNANGYDVGFYSDALLTTKLDWETELYTAATGVVDYWVRIASLSSSVDTVIYLAYGDAGITTDQSNKTGVWDSDTKWVCHDPSIGTDSTTSPANGALTSVSAVAGQIDGAGSFNGSTSLVQATNTGKLDAGGHVSLHAWVNVNTLTTTNGQRFIYQGSAAFFPNYGLEVDATGHPKFYANGRDFTAAVSASTLTASTWACLDGVWNGTNFIIYTNAGSSATSAGGNGYTGADLFLSFTATAFQVNGLIDEVRIATVTRTADWITTGYNSESSPATFYSVGGATPIGPSAPVGRGFFLN